MAPYSHPEDRGGPVAPSCRRRLHHGESVVGTGSGCQTTGHLRTIPAQARFGAAPGTRSVRRLSVIALPMQNLRQSLLLRPRFLGCPAKCYQ